MKAKRYLITGGSGFIGTNLIEEMLNCGNDLLNIDIQPPSISSHFSFWKKCDLLDKSELEKITKNFVPNSIIHLAARTDINGKSLSDYAVNVEGTYNLIMALRKINIERAIFTSTQFVHQYHGSPLNNDDYAPHTCYGESKVEMERIIKQTDLPCVWTIIRPTNIWGPWHPRYPNEFWKTLSDGFYFHPGKKEVYRSYGYVGNVVWQILKLLEQPGEQINKKVFYVGDQPINLYDWVNEFSKRLTNKEVRIAPRFFVKTLASTGDVIKKIGLNFPITSSRYKSMTTSNPAPMDDIFKLLGAPPYSLEKAVDKTIDWLRDYHTELIRE